ncbi:unnamed protein product [Acanthoscelides obtectus]|nr:unnamed protein product [Acanthoscelides obtectus]CAK1677928.1 Dimethyladenosine transferase 2, mitochondrial [Acanthoscelides obtectus]
MYLKRHSRSFANGFYRCLSESVPKKDVEPTKDDLKRTAENRIPFSRELVYFLTANPHLSSVKKYIPPRHLAVTRAPENLYLICPNVAKSIANIVFPHLRSTKSQVIAETNAGLGLITTELLEKGVDLIRLYEMCSDFRRELKEFGDVYPGRVELFTKDIFHLYRYAFIDKQDNGNRVEALLQGVSKRNWSDEPVMTIIGTMCNLYFLKYLIKSLVLQTGPTLYGRIKLFALMRPRDYAVLSATPKDNRVAYSAWAVLFNLFLDYDVLYEFPRKMFFPWDSKLKKTSYPNNYEVDKMYLVHINFKNELPVPINQLLPLYYFIKQFYGRGTPQIIPTVEKWVPDSGLNVLLPKTKHFDYYCPMGIFTTFRELKPHQILFVFKEMVNHPAYPGSPFRDMVENEMAKSETIETCLAEATFEKTVRGDLKEKLNND